MGDAQAWLAGALAGLRSKPEARPCVSFSYGGRRSEEFLPSWSLAETGAPGADGKTTHRIVRTDPETGLELRVDFVRHSDYPVAEWTARLRMEVMGVEITAVPAYNTNKRFHPKGSAGIGYVIRHAGGTVYHAGDTDVIPEIADIRCDTAEKLALTPPWWKN